MRTARSEHRGEARGRAGAPPEVVWEKTSVLGRACTYGVAREGDCPQAILLLHGWALGRRAYRGAVQSLAALGRTVYAPCLPGFGGTAAFHGNASFARYGGWLAEFLEVVGAPEPVVAVGHSFGGAVAIKLAHDHPGRVARLVLVSSVGAPAWVSSNGRARSMAERPLWDWGYSLPADLVPAAVRVVPQMTADLLGNLLRDPRSVWSSATLARAADLRPELAELRRRGLPVLALSGDDDRVVTRSSFDQLCAVLGTEGVIVDGAHSWMLVRPEELAARVAGVIAG